MFVGEIKNLLTEGVEGNHLYGSKEEIQPNEKAQEVASVRTIVNTGSFYSFGDLVSRSNAYYTTVGGPSDLDNRIEKIAANAGERAGDMQLKIARDAALVRIIVLERVVELYEKFLQHKKEKGSAIEKNVYAEMTIGGFIARLIEKRPAVFFGRSDFHRLQDGGSCNKAYPYDAVGSDNEEELHLGDTLSYIEMELSSLLGVSVPTFFINNGNRYNKGKLDKTGNFQNHGVYQALVGARFERPGKMEYKYMMASFSQNTKENGYGAEGCIEKKELLDLFAWFYEEKLFAYEEIQESARFIKTQESEYVNGTTMPIYFDRDVYKKRMRVSIALSLLDANEKGKNEGQSVYLHVVGLGLGVWAKEEEEQARVLIEVYHELIQQYSLPYISDVDFSWFPGGIDSSCEIKDGMLFEKGDNKIKIHFSKRNPAEKLEDGKLLVAQYAWDSNSMPGNEFWMGGSKLTCSGDPAAACCSTIAEIQNPYINPEMLHHIDIFN